jgi:murein DD-endopeptidase MepM/ murein hydrolase activator NlpD
MMNEVKNNSAGGSPEDEIWAEPIEDTPAHGQVRPSGEFYDTFNDRAERILQNADSPDVAPPHSQTPLHLQRLDSPSVQSNAAALVERATGTLQGTMSRIERASGRYSDQSGSRPECPTRPKLSRSPVNMEHNVISSPYGVIRTLRDGPKPHWGSDIANKVPMSYAGDLHGARNVYAAEHGVVFQVDTQEDTGLMVKIYHESGNITTRYLHLDSVTVQVNQKVSAGDVIGIMGNTGRSTGVHLHFDVLRGKQLAGTPRIYLDPANYLPKPIYTDSFLNLSSPKFK